jgi:hypothetical protein
MHGWVAKHHGATKHKGATMHGRAVKHQGPTKHKGIATHGGATKHWKTTKHKKNNYTQKNSEALASIET